MTIGQNWTRKANKGQQLLCLAPTVKLDDTPAVSPIAQIEVALPHVSLVHRLHIPRLTQQLIVPSTGTSTSTSTSSSSSSACGGGDINVRSAPAEISPSVSTLLSVCPEPVLTK
jgi:hypothetical protein